MELVRVQDHLNKKLTQSLNNTVADLLHSIKKTNQSPHVNAQYHLGSDECELLAIVDAYELCFGR